jgi:cytochrome c oxidase subunit II
LRKRLLWVLGLLAFGLLLASCAQHASQDSLKPAGPFAREIKTLFVPVFWVAVAVFVIVEGGIVLILIKYRHRKNRDQMPPQIHGNTRLEIGWTIVPAVILAFVTVPTVATIWDLARKPPADALHITVEGHQWWWGFVYTDGDMKTTYGDQGAITVADVMVIPAGRTVYLDLASVGALGAHDDQGVPDYAVIHSFWVPQLAGKQDVVPGRTNHILMQADHPGTYYGQCAEFCGLQHGKMKVRVIALSPTDWDAWVANQKQPSVTPTDPLAARGMDLFMNPLSGNRGTCVACHSLGGVSSGASAAPNLTHFAAATHECFAGCDWDTSDTAALEAWLHNPSAVKLGSKMPNYHLSDDEISALVAYLESLQ